MPISGLADSLEAGRLALGFWTFLIRPKTRRNVLTRWAEASPLGRVRLAFQALIATAVGLGLPALLLYFLLA